MELHLLCPDIQCEGCANSITKALSEIPGLSSVHVDVEAKRITLIGTEAAIAEARSRLEEIGFPPKRTID